MKLRLLLAAPLVLLAACSGNTSHSASGAGANTPTVAAVGKLAPGFDEATASGGALSLASLHGKAVYLNFFASWCPPCNEEAPAVDSLQKKYGPHGFQVVGVDVLENAQKARQFETQHHLSYPAVIDQGTLRDAYNVNGLPVHVFIDRSGIIRKIEVGELTKPEMEADIKSVL
jgi:cytochrome c biogenesis protein CcmG, thiol:disulfide interchange protein DsbE